MVNKKYCASAYLMFRSLLDESHSFTDKTAPPRIADGSFKRIAVHDSNELFLHLKEETERACSDGKAALMLSGGIDSAILASFMPKGSVVYTLKCVVPGVNVIDETAQAAEFAELNGLEQRIIPIYWEDFEQNAELLMKRKNAPIHSIEVQIYKAAVQAKKDGFERLIFGENADIIYGGMNGLLSKDWTIGEFIERYSYVMPYKVLREFEIITEPFLKYSDNGMVDAHAFLNEFFRIEALGTYTNACGAAGISFLGPFSTSEMAIPMDYERIRKGDTKYLVREVFNKIYPGKIMPPKVPLPRPMDEWLENWKGVDRPEFYPNCCKGMTGDQKWMIYALEKFFDMVEGKNA